MLCGFDVEPLPLHAYGPLCTLFYDADKPVAPDTEVGWYAQRLPKVTGPALELMCGSGRLLVPLVEQGFKLHGVDSSPAMLASCESRLAAREIIAPLFRPPQPHRRCSAFARTCSTPGCY